MEGQIILVVAVGKAKMITSEYVEPGARSHRYGDGSLGMKNNRLCGDVDFEDVEKVAGSITRFPVWSPMTECHADAQLPGVP